MSPVCSQPAASIVAAGCLAGARRTRRAEADSSCSVVPGAHVLAAHQNLAVVGDLDLDAADRGADRSGVGLERMIERDDRRRFGEPVSLDDDEAEPLPEILERRAAAAPRRR